MNVNDKNEGSGKKYKISLEFQASQRISVRHKSFVTCKPFKCIQLNRRVNSYGIVAY